ncbi:MAG: Asp-tRNA(Asn)/Glu-tRNA(Gln) amidotransferase subunit GatA [Bacillota bacterium]
MSELTWLGLRELRERLLAREVSREELVEAFAQNIERTDGELGCFLSVDRERALRRETAEDNAPGPLEGVPYAIKANICAEGVPVTCASRILDGYRSPYSAEVVTLLDSAGGALMGTTNMDEFAMGSSTESSAVRVTHNPWDPDRVPGGSSGGSAAAVASGMVPLALGSDTGGSIRQPASFCGVVGMKPTYGSVSRYGLIAFGSSLDQIGPITRSVRDCAAALDVLIRRDERDSTSVTHPHEGRFLSGTEGVEEMRGVRIGLPVEYVGEGVDGQVREVVRGAAEVFSSLGADVTECSLPHTGYALPAYYIIASAEASSNLARFDGVRYGFRAPAESMEDLYRDTRGEGFGREVKRRIMLGTFALSAGYYDAYYLRAARARQLIAREMLAALEEFDLLLSPTCPTPAFRLGERLGDPLSMYMADVCTIPANMAGIPAISVPGGLVSGLPVGIQLMGPRFGDLKVLRAAAAFQGATNHHRRRPPLAAGTGEVCGE